MTNPDSTERPEGLETRQQVTPLPSDPGRPDWLVGAEDVLETPEEGPQRPAVPLKPPAEMQVIQGGKPERPKAWSAAGSSVPKLALVSRPGPPAASPEFEEDPPPHDASEPGYEAGLDGETSGPEAPAEPAFRALEEPWYLVWTEALLTNRKLLWAVLGVGIALAAVLLWPKPGESGASLGNILRHPERFEGRSVAVRGEVLETFQIGDGHVFQLRQGRDTVVVFSATRQPRLHERIKVVGTVSTGYLDGEPRVAIFEGSSAP